MYNAEFAIVDIHEIVLPFTSFSTTLLPFYPSPSYLIAIETNQEYLRKYLCCTDCDDVDQQQFG